MFFIHDYLPFALFCLLEFMEGTTLSDFVSFIKLHRNEQQDKSPGDEVAVLDINLLEGLSALDIVLECCCSSIIHLQ